MSHDHGADCHGSPSSSVALDTPADFALVGSPNAGKSTLFNALTGMRVKTGNYPGVTVTRYRGTATIGGREVVIEDLPGVYSLDAISPDEQVVSDILVDKAPGTAMPHALILAIDTTNMRRSMNLAAQLLNLQVPTVLVLTFADELAARGGHIDVDGLSRAVGVPVVEAGAGNKRGRDQLRELMEDPASWTRPILPPPTDPGEVEGYISSVLSSASYLAPHADPKSRKIDAVLLHPVWGTVIFLLVMFLFFQILFSVAAPMQDGVHSFFDWLSGLVTDSVPGLVGRFISEALIGGVGTVLEFVPQIALLFLMISLLEGSGYLSRAAFLMDHVMSRFGLEGRAFVALLSSMACAIPGIMATRSLPSARDRLATMMAAPLMTCSARIPVYTLLIALLVPAYAGFGPFGAQGAIMFLLYLLGAFASMFTAAFWSKVAGRHARALPFYMEIPPYRVPSLRSVGSSVWHQVVSFLQKIVTAILITTSILWVALNVDVPGTPEPPTGADPAVVRQYDLQHSYAAVVGRAIEPVFEPLGFDWRINVSIIGSLSAREVFVSTLGQIAAAENPDDPSAALESMTWTDGPHAGQPLFTPATTGALLVFFMFALQCFSTIVVMVRETGGWKWPTLAFLYMFALAWTGGALTHLIVGAIAG